jgi:hypothetical protein
MMNKRGAERKALCRGPFSTGDYTILSVNFGNVKKTVHPFC